MKVVSLLALALATCYPFLLEVESTPGP